jgi:alpha-L-fucosidase
MIIDGTDPVLNDGIHGMKEEGRYYPLARGYHKLRIEYFQRAGGIGLEFLVEAPGQPKKIAPPNMLFN